MFFKNLELLLIGLWNAKHCYIFAWSFNLILVSYLSQYSTHFGGLFICMKI